MKCKICSKLVVKKNTLHDDRYGYPESFDLLECTNCGFAFLNVNFSKDQLKDLYSNYYPRKNLGKEDFIIPQSEDSILGKVKSWINGDLGRGMFNVPIKTTVLDVGCGFGESVAYHKKRGCNSFGIDADSNCLKPAEWFDLNIKNDTYKKSIFGDVKFDYITLDQVLEHLSNPLLELENLSSDLSSDGKILISLPNYNSIWRKVFGRNWIHWHAPYHENFFTLKSLNCAAKVNRLKIVKSYNCSPPSWLFYQALHLINLPTKGSASTFWCGQLQNGFRVMFIKILFKLKVFHVLTKVSDFLNVGDNLYIELEKVK